MGIYINPPDMSKETFLYNKAIEVTLAEFEAFNFSNAREQLPVVLVQNPYFSAAGVAFDSRERDVFACSLDTRPKKFFLIPTTELLESGVLSNDDYVYLKTELQRVSVSGK